MGIPCGCENDPVSYERCGHRDGLAFCLDHPDRPAFERIDGTPWCRECWEVLRSCEDHPEYPGGVDGKGIPLCAECARAASGVYDAIAGAA